MGIDPITLAVAKQYCDDTVIGGGALKGKNCTITSITPITGGNVVEFQWTLDDGTVRTDTMTVLNGSQGIQGPKGDVGERGATGSKGDTATVQVGTVTSGESPSVTNVGTNTDAVFNFVLAKGDRGEQGLPGEDGQDGKSFDIKAQFPTYAALIAAHPTGEAGDAYFVGTDENPDLYIWLTDDNEWFNNGKIAGVKGDKGEQGDDGFSPVASVSKVGKVATITIRDKVGQTTATVSDGEDGEDAQFEELPTASATNEGKICQYIGATSGSLVNGHFYQCVNQSGTFVWVEKFGSAMEKNATDRVQPNSHDLVESGSVYSAINSALSSIYTARGDLSCAELTSELLISDNVGDVYEMTDAGTTSNLFLQGAGQPIAIGDNIGIINAGEGRILYNLMANAFDLTAYQKKDLASAVEGETTVEGALGALSTNKASKVSNATAGDIATLDANGNLVDSGVKKTEVNALIPKRTVLTTTTTNMWAVFSTSQLGQNYLVSTYFGGYCATIILERFKSYIVRSSDTDQQPQLQVQEVTWSADGIKFALKIPYASPNISFTPIGGNSVIEQPTYIGSMTEADMLSELGLTSYTNYLQKLVTESDLTPGTSKTDIDSNTVYYYRSGKVVTVVFNGLTISSDVAQNARIGSLEFPHAVDSYGVYFTMADYNKNNAISVMRIDSRGYLLAASSASDQTKVVPGRYWGTVTYITG